MVKRANLTEAEMEGGERRRGVEAGDREEVGAKGGGGAGRRWEEGDGRSGHGRPLGGGGGEEAGAEAGGRGG